MPNTSHTSARDLLKKLAAERILVLDGAMGTMIQAMGLDEEGYRGARFDAWNREVRGNNDLLNLSRPDAIREIHYAYLQGRRRHRLDQHVLVDLDRAGRLRPVGHRLRAELRGRAAGARGREQGRARGRPAAVRRRRLGPDQPHRLDLAGRRQSRLPRHHLRPAPQGLWRAGARLADRRRRSAADRDDLRHAERQGRDLRHRRAVRGARRRRAGDDLRHHHRPLRAAALGPDAGGVLERGAARLAGFGRPELRARRRADARAHRRHGAGLRHADLRLPERRPAERVRPLSRVARGHGEAPRRVRRRPAWSTSSAAAAAPRPTTSAPSPKRCAARRRARSRRRCRCCGCPGWSRSR